MGVSFSIEALTQGLAHCDKNIMKHILGQPATEVKAVFQRFETQRLAAAEMGGEADSTPHAILPFEPGPVNRKCISMTLPYDDFKQASEVLKSTGCFADD